MLKRIYILYLSPTLASKNDHSFLTSGESKWQPLNGSRRMVRISAKTDNQKRSEMDSPKVQARKKSTKVRFLCPETARWGGGLSREGVVAKNFVPALETLSSLGFEEGNPGCPGNFAGMSRTPGGVQKVCAKKLRAHFSFPKSAKTSEKVRKRSITSENS